MTTATLPIAEFVPDFRALNRVRNGGAKLSGQDAVKALWMRDRNWVWLPLKLDWELSLKPVSDFWLLYPRTLTIQGKTFVFNGTHQADRMVYYVQTEADIHELIL
jgi:hypothetical protein